MESWTLYCTPEINLTLILYVKYSGIKIFFKKSKKKGKIPICGPECQRTLGNRFVPNVNKAWKYYSTETENKPHLTSQL